MSEFAHNPNRYLAFIKEPLPRILHTYFRDKTCVLKGLYRLHNFWLSQFTMSNYIMQEFSCLVQQSGNTTRVIPISDIMPYAVWRCLYLFIHSFILILFLFLRYWVPGSIRSISQHQGTHHRCWLGCQTRQKMRSRCNVGYNKWPKRPTLVVAQRLAVRQLGQYLWGWICVVWPGFNYNKNNIFFKQLYT